jgi:hypothetical protein
MRIIILEQKILNRLFENPQLGQLRTEGFPPIQRSKCKEEEWIELYANHSGVVSASSKQQSIGRFHTVRKLS